MKNSLTLLIGVIVILVLVGYMFTFQVRYDEVAVLTTFEKATMPKSLKEDPGLYWKLPWPVQKVTTYSRKVQVLEDQLEELQTADNYAIIVKTYLAWRIENPYAFFRSLNNVETARKQLEPMMRDIKGVISSYKFSDLVNTDSSALKLREIEQACADQIRQKLSTTNYGIEIEQVGIRRVVLPEKTTEQVFERMRKTRERIAQSIRSEGESQAATIKSQAKSAQERILAFAERRAQAIRDEGDREAASYFKAFASNEDFAVFLRQIEALKQMLSHNTTFILDANNLSMLKLFNEEPGSKMPAAVTAKDTAEQAAARN